MVPTRGPFVLTLNRRIILIDEMTLDKLQRDRRLAHSAAANNHQLVLAL